MEPISIQILTQTPFSHIFCFNFHTLSRTVITASRFGLEPQVKFLISHNFNVKSKTFQTFIQDLTKQISLLTSKKTFKVERIPFLEHELFLDLPSL